MVDDLNEEHWRCQALLSALFPDPVRDKPKDPPPAADFLERLRDWWDDPSHRQVVIEEVRDQGLARVAQKRRGSRVVSGTTPRTIGSGYSSWAPARGSAMPAGRTAQGISRVGLPGGMVGGV